MQSKVTYYLVANILHYEVDGVEVYVGDPMLMSPDVLVSRIARQANVSHAEAGRMYLEAEQA